MDERIKKAVREAYARIAKKNCCCAPSNSCCGGVDLAEDTCREFGYSDKQLRSVPDGSNLGLGCGNPITLASLKEGEIVLDLGCGAGFDCFLAANIVGDKGRVIGVDMTPEMIEKARENTQKGNYNNVEFRLGEIENLPAGDNSVDVVISNCVINLSPDKERVFREAFRVLRPHGRLMVSDIVLLNELPDNIKNNVSAYVGCISGAIMRDEYLGLIEKAGFQDVTIRGESRFPVKFLPNDATANADLNDIADSIESITVSGIKPD